MEKNITFGHFQLTVQVISVFIYLHVLKAITVKTAALQTSGISKSKTPADVSKVKNEKKETAKPQKADIQSNEKKCEETVKTKKVN